MNYEILGALVGFAFVTSVTPGPNNLMLMASGANFGVRRTVPHMLGISLGHAFMVTMGGVGILQLFEMWPPAFTVLNALSVAYLLWLAWKIAQAAPVKSVAAEAKPFTFLQAAAFQWVNPKAWAMALTAVSAYKPGETFGAILLVAIVFSCVNLPSVTIWAVLGQQVRRWLSSPERLRLFNWTMAVLLVLSLIPVLMPLG